MTVQEHYRRPEPQREGRQADVQWMASWGTPMHEAAERVGLSPKSLQRWLHKHDRKTLRRLVANSEARGLNIKGEVSA